MGTRIEMRLWLPAMALSFVVLMLSAAPAQATFPGRNGKIAAQYEDEGIATINPDGSGLTVLPGLGSDPTWSPGGTMLAFSRREDGGRCGSTDGDIQTSTPDGSNVANLTRNPAEDVEPAWSPDGDRIAFVSDREGTSNIACRGFGRDLYVMNADGSDVRRITHLDSQLVRWPDWSPDGSKIAFEFNLDIWVINPDGTGLRNLTNTQGDPNQSPYANEFFASWSPDGRLIAFSVNSSAHPNFFQLYTVRPDGTGMTRVVTAWEVGYPSWSPDGSLIAFWTHIMRPDGSGFSDFASASVPLSRPDWQPIPFKNTSKKCKALPGSYRNHGQCVKAGK